MEGPRIKSNKTHAGRRFRMARECSLAAEGSEGRGAGPALQNGAFGAAANGSRILRANPPTPIIKY